tara:strand:+ start:1416 stop:1619 length:204 start_codon:yes stop_codon:yes gene_type:complete
MGNVVSMIMISKIIQCEKEKEKEKDNKYIKDPILLTKYCYYCKINFENKIKYNEHLQDCEILIYKSV